MILLTVPLSLLVQQFVSGQHLLASFVTLMMIPHPPETVLFLPQVVPVESLKLFEADPFDAASSEIGTATVHPSDACATAFAADSVVEALASVLDAGLADVTAAVQGA